MSVYSRNKNKIRFHSEYAQQTVGGTCYNPFDIYEQDYCMNSFPVDRRKPVDLKRNPTDAIRVEIRNGIGIVETLIPNKTSQNSVNRVRDIYPWVDNSSPPLIDDLYGVVGAKLRKQIQEGALSFAENIGEYQESVGILRGAAVTIYNGLNLLRGKIPPKWAALTKRGRTRKWKIRDVSAAWVGSHFAIAPVLGTLAGLAFQMSSTGSLIATRRLQGTAQYTVSKVENTGYYGKGSYKSELHRKVKGICFATMDVGVPRYNLGTPAEWVWAAIPFSFVVDWMLGVSSWLSQFTPLPPSLHITGSWIEVRSKDIETRLTQPLFDWPSYTVMPAFYHEKTISRSRMMSLPFSVCPRWTFPANYGILTTAVALLHVLKRS